VILRFVGGVCLAACMAATGVTPRASQAQIRPGGGSPGPMADTCGVEPAPANAAPPAGRGAAPRIYPPGQYPITLPAASHLGARNDLPNPYGAGIHWGTLPEGRVWGSVVGIDIAPDGTIWTVERCGVFGTGGRPCLDHPVDPIVQFDASGKFLRSFGAKTIVSPHKLDVDGDGNIWVTDMGTSAGIGQQVLKYTPTGEIVLRLGTAGVTGDGPNAFQQPTDVAVAPNGDIYVADGHSTAAATGNARIVKFDRTGTFLKAWGRKGLGPGEFDLPHDIELDSRGRVFVADRQNNRVQVFDADGALEAVWYQFGRPSALFIDRNDVLYVADSESRDGRTNTGRSGLPTSGYGYNAGARRGIRIGSARDGTVTQFVPDPCPYPYPGVSSMTEGLAVAPDGTIYGSEWLGTVRRYDRR
jgi:sugar lactone lactonase YvrE